MKRMLVVALMLFWPCISFASIVTFGNYYPIAPPSIGDEVSYPSIIEVSGLSGVVVGDVNITLLGLIPASVDNWLIELVSPTGEHLGLMAYSGDSANPDNVFLTFDNEADRQLPNAGGIQSGTYQVNTLSDSDLSIFNGIDPNGDWSLSVYGQNTNASEAAIAYGWTLNLETVKIPIPKTSLLLASALLGLIGARRKK